MTTQARYPRFRRARIAAAVGLGSGVWAITSPANATGAGSNESPTDPSTPSPPVSPLTVTPDGWIHYNQSPGLTVANTHISTINGTVDSDGNCHIPQHLTSSPRPGHVNFTRELAYNPALCQEQLSEGSLSTQQGESLGLNPYATPFDFPPGVTPTTPSGQGSTPPLPPGDPLAASASSYRGSDAYLTAVTPQPLCQPDTLVKNGVGYKCAASKDWYWDPADIVITSLAQNLNWGVQFSNDQITTSASTIVPYAFRWDNWYTTGGPSDSIYKSSNNTIAYEDSYLQQKNTDFEAAMVYAFGPDVIAVCGGDSPAVFTQNMSLDGTTDSYSVFSNDSATGGCSDLVSYEHADVWGTAS